MTHKLEPKYKARLEQLEHLHPPAHRFLTRLELDGPAHGLRLSTSTHAHVYKLRAFLMRVELVGRTRAPTNIVLSPKPWLHIKEDAVDRADLLFPKTLTALLMKHGAFRAGWAPRGTSPTFELQPNTPHAFFDELLTLLYELKVEEPQSGLP